jgi:hypothetical protein
VLNKEEHKQAIVVITQGSAHNDPRGVILSVLKVLKDENVALVTTSVGYPGGFVSTSRNLSAEFMLFNLLFEHTTVLVYGVYNVARRFNLLYPRAFARCLLI